MDIVKAASDWARFEMLAAAVFAGAGLGFVLAGFGLRQFGGGDLARGFVIPLWVAGGLLLVLGTGLFVPAQARLAAVPGAVAADSAGFLAGEIARAEKVLNDYRIALFGAFPALIAGCALALAFLHGPAWRGGLITAMAMFAVMILVDGASNARLKAYRAQLAEAGAGGL